MCIIYIYRYIHIQVYTYTHNIYTHTKYLHEICICTQHPSIHITSEWIYTRNIRMYIHVLSPCQWFLFFCVLLVPSVHTRNIVIHMYIHVISVFLHHKYTHVISEYAYSHIYYVHVNVYNIHEMLRVYTHLTCIYSCITVYIISTYT